jgi:A/G-specific adenine glycosylase
MDLGATLCTRRRPRCEACPFTAECIAFNTTQIDELPGKKPKKTIPIRSTCMLLIENAQGEFLLEKRPSNGLWGGLWGFPEISPEQLDQHLAAQGLQRLMPQPLTDFRHTFTHFHLDITPVHVIYGSTDSPAGYGLDVDRVADIDTHIWYALAAPPAIGLTRPVTRMFEQLQLFRAPVMDTEAQNTKA